MQALFLRFHFSLSYVLVLVHTMFYNVVIK